MQFDDASTAGAEPVTVAYRPDSRLDSAIFRETLT